jgi:2-polyprenyl-3-methyl-5-hydroxy-6-metoxy-1,4-benzoquinol methylase
MLSKVKKFYRGIVSWVEWANNRVDLELMEVNLSPIDRHIVYNGIADKHGLFHPAYAEWRVRRINKMLEIYGFDFFKGKKILELGAGHADIGAFFAEMGADVLCLDGRIQNINFARLKHRKISNLRFAEWNLEGDFTHFGKFDLIIDFGLIYHLKDVEEHLRRCFRMSNDIIMETVVCDSTDPNTIFYCDEKSEINEEALEGTGSRPSPFYIERITKENNFEAVRFFTPDLNAGWFYYDWKHKNDNSGRGSSDFLYRRFWRLKKIEA